MSKQELMTLKDIDKALSKHVSDAGARIEKPTGQSIGIKGKKFKYKDDVIGRVASFVIVDFIRANAYYDSPFHEDTIELPACLALSVDGNEMKPLEHAPRKQSPQCDGCNQNAWGSADVGRGKSCAEQYRLAVLAVDSTRNETYATCDMATITVPPTSKKNFGQYVRALDENHSKPPLAFLTEFSFDDNFDHEVLLFEVNKPYKDAKTLSAILSRVDEAREMLMAPPDFSGNVKESASKRKSKKKVKVKAKKKTKKKAASKKKTKKKAGRSKYA